MCFTLALNHAPVQLISALASYLDFGTIDVHLEVVLYTYTGAGGRLAYLDFGTSVLIWKSYYVHTYEVSWTTTCFTLALNHAPIN